ncbi:hypothetical protein [Methanoculleus chikugoensis]|uniref:hypothetical protein n=1 Tax=Methanoculleus chikugoensis TaxID=118126 RepID=UPI000AAA651C|nr:hypothetical protein [Methanoculleus chikugoensis]
MAQTTGGSRLRRKAAAFHSREREGTGTPGMTGTPAAEIRNQFSAVIGDCRVLPDVQSPRRSTAWCLYPRVYARTMQRS